MLYYSNEQLATIIGVPIVTILLIWTVAIFHINRKKWNSYDIAVVAIVIQSILRNLAILGYTALLIAKRNSITSDYCKSIVWIFNSVHTFQASSLTTLAVIALFTVKLFRKQQNLQQYLTPTHVIYQLFCLTTLCACVGVAAILAQEENDGQKNINFVQYGTDDDKAKCKLMPFELDIKFNIFIIVLHIFLAMVSVVSFLMICVNHMKLRRHGFDYLKKSSSDLSELSLSLSASVVNPNDNMGKNYYDTYTIPRLARLDSACDSKYEAPHQNLAGNPNYQQGFGSNREPVWNSDLSNVSMTVSSTNSKRPCLNKALQEEEESRTGLHTMYPILAVCYIFNHLPLIVLCIFPQVIAPWPVSGVALWMGQLQDVLIPIGLALVDSRFCKWVTKAYKCSERRRVEEKVPPGVGLDGKFRHFGSQPQSLEVAQPQLERAKPYSATEPKFPITNGSLYTSIDGRLPIIHNYRRHKDNRGCQRPLAPHSLNVNLHSSHLKRQEYVRSRQNITFNPAISNNTVLQLKHNCPKCENHVNVMYNPCYPPLNQNFAAQQQLYHEQLYGDRSPYKPRLCHQEPRNRKPLHNRRSLSQDSLCVLDNLTPMMSRVEITRPRLVKSKRKRVALNNRISRSEDCLNDIEEDLRKFRHRPGSLLKRDVCLRSPKNRSKQDFACASSDDEYLTDCGNLNDAGCDFDASSQSSCSITTEANCDFEFYQSKDIDGTSDLMKERNASVGDVESRMVSDLSKTNSYETISDEFNRKTEMAGFGRSAPNHKNGFPNGFTEEILARSGSRNSKNSTPDFGNLPHHFKITRSSSKRSLENFYAYVDEEIGNVDSYKIQRSNSYMTIEDRQRYNKPRKADFGDNKKSHVYRNNGNNTRNLLENLNTSIAYLEDIYNHNVHHQENSKPTNHSSKIPYYSGSVPDFKKIFISEYI